MLLLDNIIFSLQFSGGISIVWYEHLKRLLIDKRFKELHLIEHKNDLKNIFRKQLDIPEDILLKNSARRINIKRYFDVNYKCKQPFIFHSSYYRICKNVNAVNITTVHDFTYEYFVRGLRKRIHCWQKYRALRSSDYIICISENTKKDLLKFLPEIEPEKVRVVYNGVSDEYFEIIDKKGENINLPYEKNTFVLFIGARSGYKNFELAVNAVVETSLKLVIVGGLLTPEEHSLLDQKLGQERYKYVGRISNKELNLLYNNAFCLLYPSAYEGFGIPVLEAQKAGCPVIAYNSSSIPEIIGDTPLLMQALSVSEIHRGIRLLFSETVKKEIIKQGLDNVKRFTWDNTYEQTCAIYRDALNSKA